MRSFFFISLLFFQCMLLAYGQSPRRIIPLEQDWRTVMHEEDSTRHAGFQQISFRGDSSWQKVDVPHNWDTYGGYRRLLHGNLHGYAWYRKTFTVVEKGKNKRFYLFFEGVGSYATVWLNGRRVGYHAGGRTTFTLDVSGVLYTDGRTNTLAVRADHPAEIRDLPWVDGGCSSERGFSEGSQPMGIFRPVSLVIKSDVNIAPFGVHYWNDETAGREHATIHQNVEIFNSSLRDRKLKIVTNMLDAGGRRIATTTNEKTIRARSTEEFSLADIQVNNPRLWRPKDAYLYTIETSIYEGRKLLDREQTAYGVRTIRWPKGLKPVGTNQLFVNGEPVFIHGIAEYEHKLGGSHAFPEQEIMARVGEMKALGFNSFRDAHQPHNLRYQKFWDENGILLWTQMAAHIWFDNDDFRRNFKVLLRDWVKERRNSPSVFLWGLENESTLPEDFARECTEIIRSLDPTASIQRLVTTCNGGAGTDWDVPQNWTGTYGGDHRTYGEDLKKQLLVGEYGAWRTLEMHAEPPYLPNHSMYSEDRFTEILETKLRLADSVQNETIGHYLWLWNSHDNPGRVQGGEGLRDLDKIGPVNYKGLLTPWGEPTDAYFMYRAHYGDNDPMVYIASHTWPNRWLAPGIKNDIRIYSNCEEVELFNDLGHASLGVQKKPGFGRPFVFNGVDVQYNVLYVEGRNKGRTVARDTIVLFNLPESPHFDSLRDRSSTLLKGAEQVNYLYRVNCGGGRYVDTFGQEWSADQPYHRALGWGSFSWTDAYEGIHPFFASQRRIFDPIKGVADWDLFQSFRYGLGQLAYQFDVPPGEYQVELYFAEPWIGTGGGEDARGRRLFDVAINGRVVEKELDIWREVGHDVAMKRVYHVRAEEGKIRINFPRILAGQAVVHAIAVAGTMGGGMPEQQREHYNLEVMEGSAPVVKSWMDLGQTFDEKRGLSFQHLPGALYGADFFKAPAGRLALKFRWNTDVYVLGGKEPEGFESIGDTVTDNRGQAYPVYKRVLNKDVPFDLPDVTPGTVVAFAVRSGLQPAYDLKKADTYKANEVHTSGGAARTLFLNQERLRFTEDTGWLAFDIKVGVADVYSLTLKYHNPFKESKFVTLALEMPDGTVLKREEQLRMDPTREGKWNYVNTNTGTMINAGTYRVVVRGIDVNEVYIDALDVQ